MEKTEKKIEDNYIIITDNELWIICKYAREENMKEKRYGERYEGRRDYMKETGKYVEKINNHEGG